MNRCDIEHWSRLWRTATLRDAPGGLYDRLVAMYCEPHRHYHNQQHIADCLNEFEQVRQLAVKADAVELALWFHDAVYDPRAGDNEERSADFAERWLAAGGAAAGLVRSVRQLILATKAHDGTLHPDAPLLVDVDLSILGQPPDRFWEYENAIRAEYSWVKPATFAAKRSEILKSFLARSRLYQTESFFQRFEVQARENLRAAIARLCIVE